MSVEKPLLLVVACVLVTNNPEKKEGTGRRVLLARRPKGKTLAGLWEFPGGKIETGESPEQALIRELREELAIEAVEADLKPLCFASHAYENFHLLMPLYFCDKFRGVPQPCEGQVLRWVSMEHLAADYRIYSRLPLAIPQKGTLNAEDFARQQIAENETLTLRYPLPPADIPLVPFILQALSG